MDEFNEIGEKGRRLYWRTVSLLPGGRVVLSARGCSPAGGSKDAEDSQRGASGAEEPSEQQRKQQHKRRKPR